MNNKENKVIARALTMVANRILCTAANSRCMIIFHQPKQPESVKNFRKF
ncbi:MAG: cyclic lactone autoinducer peptide [Lachnospiraceae bacterium]|nr:cyclic lactone autoinducer peptide [Lachnospiraceae bacterium]